MATPKPAQLFSTLADTLEERCKSAKIPIKRGIDELGNAFARVQMPNGREFRGLYIEQPERLQRLLDSDFEKYVFLGDYAAIASYDDLYIEAVFQSRTAHVGFAIARAFGADPKKEPRQQNLWVDFGSGSLPSW